MVGGLSVSTIEIDDTVLLGYIGWWYLIGRTWCRCIHLMGSRLYGQHTGAPNSINVVTPLESYPGAIMQLR